MNSRREYELAFVGLKPGIHAYEYRITDRFFDAYQQQDFTGCEADVKLFLEKNQGFMLLRFEVTGKLNVFCDRMFIIYPERNPTFTWRTGFMNSSI
jgi:hypothetical protein